MKKLLLALVLFLFPSLAWAQCNGVFPANTLCGNLSGSPQPPAAFAASGTIAGPVSSTNGGLVTWANTLGTQVKDGNGTSIPGTYNFTGTVNLSGSPAVAGPGASTVGDFACWNNTSGALLKDCPLGTVNVQSGNYTIATSDCNNTVLANGTLSTITLPATAGFPAPCVITVKNSNPSRAQKLSGFPAGIAVNAINWCGGGNMCLPPNQTVQVQITQASGSWFATQVINRWRPNGVTIFADASLGSDSNDCLASGSAACATLQQAYNIACLFTDSQSTTAVSFTGTMHNFLSGGCGVPRLIQINGTGTAIIDDNNTPGVAFECDDICEIQLGASGSITLSSLATNSTDLMAQRGGLVDVTNTTFITAAGASAAIVQSKDGANVNLNSGNTFAGGGGTTIGFFANASRGGHIVTGAAQTVTGTWTVTDGCVASSTGVVDASGGAFSGGTVTGNRATATTAGGVNGATSCPGNANTTATAPGWLN